MSNSGWIWGQGKEGKVSNDERGGGEREVAGSFGKPDLEGSVFTAPREVRDCTPPCHLVKGFYLSFVLFLSFFLWGL